MINGLKEDTNGQMSSIQAPETKVSSMNEKIKKTWERFRNRSRRGFGMVEIKLSRSQIKQNTLEIPPVDQAEERLSGTEDTAEEILQTSIIKNKMLTWLLHTRMLGNNQDTKPKKPQDKRKICNKY